MGKCEWKPETRPHFMKGIGYFPCKGFYKFRGNETPVGSGWKYCPYCGANIKTPHDYNFNPTGKIEYI